MKKFLTALLPPLLAGLVLNGLAQLFLRNLYIFLGVESQFGVIFAQLRHQPMDGQPALVVLICALFWLPIWSFWAEKPRLRPIFVLLVVLSWLGGFVLALLELQVNGIRFGYVLFSLLDLLRKGIL